MTQHDQPFETFTKIFKYLKELYVNKKEGSGD